MEYEEVIFSETLSLDAYDLLDFCTGRQKMWIYCVGTQAQLPKVYPILTVWESP